MAISYDLAKAEALRALVDRFGPEKADEILQVLCGGLREQFAMAALAACTENKDLIYVNAARVARKATEIADEMLRLRKTG